MRGITTFILVFINLGLHAQTEITVIGGETVGRQSNYAYFLSKSKVYSSKIVGNRFEFLLPRTNDYELGTLFLWSDSLSVEQAYQMFKNKDNDYRSIAIENSYIIVSKVTKEAIVKGGKLNVELDEMYQSLQDKSYDDFFNKYPNSPVSLTLLRILISMSRISPYFRGELTLKAYYEKLSHNLKQSEKGKELWGMIAPTYKTKE